MEKLSKVDISEIRKASVLGGDPDITDLCDAYLALREEVEQKDDKIYRLKNLLDGTLKQMAELKAENQALKTRLESTEQASKRVIESLISS